MPIADLQTVAAAALRRYLLAELSDAPRNLRDELLAELDTARWDLLAVMSGPEYDRWHSATLGAALADLAPRGSEAA